MSCWIHFSFWYIFLALDILVTCSQFKILPEFFDDEQEWTSSFRTSLCSIIAETCLAISYHWDSGFRSIYTLTSILADSWIDVPLNSSIYSYEFICLLPTDHDIHYTFFPSNLIFREFLSFVSYIWLHNTCIESN